MILDYVLWPIFCEKLEIFIKSQYYDPFSCIIMHYASILTFFPPICLSRHWKKANIRKKWTKWKLFFLYLQFVRVFLCFRSHSTTAEIWREVRIKIGAELYIMSPVDFPNKKMSKNDRKCRMYLTHGPTQRFGAHRRCLAIAKIRVG
jgi:hypothetical protein